MTYCSVQQHRLQRTGYRPRCSQQEVDFAALHLADNVIDRGFVKRDPQTGPPD
jgi:hypothetical protein